MGSYPWLSTFLTDARETAAPSRGAKDGLTITGIAADSPVAGATGARAARRLISVAAMGLGALAGALLVLRVHIVYPLVIALVILAAVAVVAVARARNPRTSV